MNARQVCQEEALNISRWLCNPFPTGIMEDTSRGAMLILSGERCHPGLAGLQTFASCSALIFPTSDSASSACLAHFWFRILCGFGFGFINFIDYRQLCLFCDLLCGFILGFKFCFESRVNWNFAFGFVNFVDLRQLCLFSIRTFFTLYFCDLLCGFTKSREQGQWVTPECDGGKGTQTLPQPMLDNLRQRLQV